MPSTPAQARLFVFVLVILFSLIVLGIDAHLAEEFTRPFYYFDYGMVYPPAPLFSKLALATAAITILSLSLMWPNLLCRCRLRLDRGPLDLVVELVPSSLNAWANLLTERNPYINHHILAATTYPIATFVYTTKFGDGWFIPDSCDNAFTSFCAQYRTAWAFSLLTWVILMIYWFLLFGFSVRAHSMGNSEVWFTGVTVAEFASDSVSGPSMRHARVGGATYP
ncbi:hypothetical protein DL93DRAFT_2100225 [Clavulina sp. PMI_390]|nr:hypothetical protein DL93DRAFT_2100225 [Clavulina sp. PMI_390]